MKRFLTALVYLYPLAFYFLIYLPLIVPRLDEWIYMPWYFTVLVALPYLSVMILVGIACSQRSILMHSILLSAVSELAIAVLASFHMPGFRKVEMSSIGDDLMYWLAVFAGRTLMICAVFEMGSLIGRCFGSREKSGGPGSTPNLKLRGNAESPADP